MLKDLDEYNKEARESLMRGFPNGIKCPECEKNGSITELLDNIKAPLVLTHPAQMQVYCLVCGFIGYRIT